MLTNKIDEKYCRKWKMSIHVKLFNDQLHAIWWNFARSTLRHRNTWTFTEIHEPSQKYMNLHRWTSFELTVDFHWNTNRSIQKLVYCQYGENSLTFRALALRQRETASARNVRLYYPYRLYTNLFILSICISTLPTQHTTFISLEYPHRLSKFVHHTRYSLYPVSAFQSAVLIYAIFIHFSAILFSLIRFFDGIIYGWDGNMDMHDINLGNI